jgi:hypothetical protein
MGRDFADYKALRMESLSFVLSDKSSLLLFRQLPLQDILLEIFASSGIRGFKKKQKIDISLLLSLSKGCLQAGRLVQGYYL